MVDIKVKQHTIEMSLNHIEYENVEDHNMTVCLVNGNQRYTLRLTYDNKIIDEKVMTIYVESKNGTRYAHLRHLNIPKSIRGIGIGKMCLAIFYNILQMKNINMFSMKFGGGSDSYSYLRYLGFNEKYVNTSRNTKSQGDSAMVGEYKSLGSRHDEWKLDPISISEFPTHFFD